LFFSVVEKLRDAQKNLEDETLNRINLQNQLQTKEVSHREAKRDTKAVVLLLSHLKR
jgi:hypothetical protein